MHASNPIAFRVDGRQILLAVVVLMTTSCGGNSDPDPNPVPVVRNESVEVPSQPGEDRVSQPTTKTTPNDQPATQPASDESNPVVATPKPEVKPNPVAKDESTDMGQGIRRRWTITGEDPVYAATESMTTDQVSLRIDKETVRTIEAADLSAEDQWFLRHWNDDSKRRALRKFSEIGSVGCDKDGAIQLGLSQSGCTDNDLRLAESLPEVTLIALFETPVSDQGLQVLAGLKNLKELYLEETDVKGPGFEHLAGLDKLELFKYSPDPGPGHAPEFVKYLAHLTGLKSLRQLDLWFCEFDEDALKPIGEITTLTKLSLLGTQFPAGEVQHLQKLQKLEELDLGDGDLTDADMLHLQGMSNLRVIDVAGGQLTKTGLERLGKLVKLEKIKLPRGLKDADLAPLATLTKLKSLSLYGEDLTDECLAHLSGMHEMQDLSLPQNITVKGLQHLTGMKHLGRLHFTGERVSMTEAMNLVVDRQGRSVVEALQIILRPDIVDKEGKLTWLDLDSRPKPDRETLKYLSQLPDLRSLSFGKDVNDDWLGDLPSLPQLTSLQFRGDRFDKMPIRLSGAGIQHLAENSALTYLNFSACVFSENALAPLNALSKLESLTISECELAAGNLEAIGRITSLKMLDIREVEGTDRLDDDKLRQFSGLTNLEHLSVTDSVTLAGVSHLKSLQKLNSLQLDWSSQNFGDLFKLLTEQFGRSPQEALRVFLRTSHTDSGDIVGLRWPRELKTNDDDLITVVSAAPKLQRLGLPQSITDDGLRHVSRLSQLQELSVRGTEISDAGLAHLTELQRLKSITIDCEKVTDAGLDHVGKLAGLKSIYLYGTKVTDDGVNQLQSNLPDASIRK